MTSTIVWLLVLGASVVALVFFHTQIGWTEGGRPVWTDARAYDITAAERLKAAGIDIPYDIAQTEEAEILPGRDMVINIQDAHASLSAQHSIANLLDSLVTNYDLSLIALEGASGYIDTSLLKTFPIKKIRDDTAACLVQEDCADASLKHIGTVRRNRPERSGIVLDGSIQ